MNFGRRSFASSALILGAAVGFAAPRSARAEESTDRAERMLASDEIVRIQRSLRRAKKRLEQAEIQPAIKNNAMASLREAEAALRDVQGYLTTGKAAEE
jgi:hypothetical protein